MGVPSSVLVGSIQHRTDRPKPWRARFHGPDGRQRSKSFTRKVDAERWLRAELGKLDKGEWLDPNAGRITVAEWSETWLRGLTLKPKTRAGYESILRSRVLPTFADNQLRQVTPAAVREWMAAMAAEVGPARIRQARQLLHQMLEVAVADELIARNPTKRVKAPSVRPRRQLFLTAEQVSRLADACEQRQRGAGVLIRFLAYTGLRWGEAVALRRSVVNLDRRRVRVKESATEVAGRLEWGSPKTHETRTVILPGFLADRLAAHVKGMEADHLVFTAPRGGPLRSSNFRRDVWAKACEVSEMPEGFLVHDLRDTAASLAISAGASIKAVQRMLGHASAKMTLDTYGSLFEEDLEDLADRLDARFREADVAHTRPSDDNVVHFPR
ncbi:site-specific integrase [soil metagenome]